MLEKRAAPDLLLLSTKVRSFPRQKTGGSHNEHLVPENGPFEDFGKQMDYNNLFACCIDSRDLKKKERSKRHCGESKEDRPIRGFITEENCRNFFRYNILGEIIPNGDFDCWKDYVSHKNELTKDVKDAFEAIEILNLNCHFLVEDRKGDLDKMLRTITNLPKEKVDQKIQEFGNAGVYPRYIDMLLYFMGKKK